MPIFGQVWLWSSLAFLLGAVLCWLLVARPARNRVGELEAQLATRTRRPMAPERPEPVSPVEDSLVPGRDDRTRAYGLLDTPPPLPPERDRLAPYDQAPSREYPPQETFPGGLSAPPEVPDTELADQPRAAAATQYLDVSSGSLTAPPEVPQMSPPPSDRGWFDDELEGDAANQGPEEQPAVPRNRHHLVEPSPGEPFDARLIDDVDEDTSISSALDASDDEPRSAVEDESGGTVFTQRTHPIPGELIRQIDEAGKEERGRAAEASDTADNLVDDLSEDDTDRRERTVESEAVAPPGTYPEPGHGRTEPGPSFGEPGHGRGESGAAFAASGGESGPSFGESGNGGGESGAAFTTSGGESGPSFTESGAAFAASGESGSSFGESGHGRGESGAAFTTSGGESGPSFTESGHGVSEPAAEFAGSGAEPAGAFSESPAEATPAFTEPERSDRVFAEPESSDRFFTEPESSGRAFTEPESSDRFFTEPAPSGPVFTEPEREPAAAFTEPERQEPEPVSQPEEPQEQTEIVSTVVPEEKPASRTANDLPKRVPQQNRMPSAAASSVSVRVEPTPSALPKRVPSKPRHQVPFGVQPSSAPEPAPVAAAEQPEPQRSLFEPVIPAEGDGMATPPPPHRLRQGSGGGRGPFGPGSAMPLPGGASPSPEFTIKASVAALRYCTPESPQFGRTVAEVWFRTAADAERVGFRPVG